MNVRDINSADFSSQKTPEDKIKFLLRYAVLAPSTHNSQPWLFKIQKDSCQIFVDRRIYSIKEADPSGRDLYVSFGCLVENLVTASRRFGVIKEARFINDGYFISEVSFINLDQSVADDSLAPLLRAIIERVNARGIFKSQPVTLEVLAKIQSLAENGVKTYLVTDKDKIKKLANLTSQGLRLAYGRPSFRQEMSNWVHHSLSRKKNGIPGYSFRMSLPIYFIFPYLLKKFNIGSKVGKLNEMSIASSPLVTIFTASDDNPHGWFETGRTAERLMLWARVWGMKTSIFVAAIEIGDLYKEVQNIISSADRPQLLMCIGYMNFQQKPNLRHAVEEKIINK